MAKPTLLSIYSALTQGEITLDQAAAAYGHTPRVLKMAMTKHGARFPLVMDTLDKIAAGTVSREQATTILDVLPRTVNSLMLTWKVQRPMTASSVNKVSPKIKFAVHRKFALDMIRGKLSVDKAAEAAGISERQMRRDVAALLKRHLAMAYADLAKLSLYQLKRIADEIEDKEVLDEATKTLADEIACGKTSPQDEAIKRVAAKRIARFPIKRARKPKNVRSGPKTGG